MPAPGPGGTQSSLAGMVAWLTKPFRAKPNSVSGNQPPRDINSFQDTFQPSDAAFSPGYPLVPTQREPPRRWDYNTFWSTVYTCSEAMLSAAISAPLEAPWRVPPLDHFFCRGWVPYWVGCLAAQGAAYWAACLAALPPEGYELTDVDLGSVGVRTKRCVQIPLLKAAAIKLAGRHCVPAAVRWRSAQFKE